MASIYKSKNTKELNLGHHYVCTDIVFNILFMILLSIFDLSDSFLTILFH